jgi:hypothetical protein
MFIPQGTALHENLATSYVLVEALVSDLCEGGFSGVVDIVLRDTDARIVIAQGKVAAVIERRSTPNWKAEPQALPYQRTTVEELASIARRERGRVSIYSYSTDTANAVAGRINAEPLYTRLSTEFADLEKMISKLARERDRQWFIEINIESGTSALLHLKEDRTQILVARGRATLDEYEIKDLMGSRELGDLLDESNRAGGTFDVYFKGASDPHESTTAHESSTPHGSPGTFESPAPLEAIAQIDEAPKEARDEVSQAVKEAKAAYRSLMLDDSSTATSSRAEAAPPAFDHHSQSEGLVSTSEGSSRDEVDAAAPTMDELSLVQEELRKPGDLSLTDEAMQMAEIKRLMGEIARTIDEATQAVEQRGSFAMYLRAGQLKVADRYPFLDPFGSEFEYLAGEIVFVGEASAADFVAGLTEALTRAVQGVTESSSQAPRLRARITEGLQWLLKSQRAEFEQFGLDQSIEQIISIVTPVR